MCGKSAHGNGGKVPYYEHGWLTKRNGCLLKPVFKCDPYRIGAKILESVVLEKIDELLNKPKMAQEIISLAKNNVKSGSKKKECDRARVRVREFGYQLDTLAERLSELPKSLSPQIIYKQMEKIEGLRKEEEKRFERLQSEGTETKLPCALETYQDFLKILQKMKNHPQGKSNLSTIIQALVQKIEIFPNSFKIYFLSGKHEIEVNLKELPKEALSSNKGQTNPLLKSGSQSLTIGASNLEFQIARYLKWLQNRVPPACPRQVTSCDLGPGSTLFEELEESPAPPSLLELQFQQVSRSAAWF